MLFHILPSELLKIAKNMSELPDSFSQWAYKHIVNELSYFLEQNPEWHYICNEKKYCYLPELDKDLYLNYDGYWMLQCKDEKELNDLLKAWYCQLELDNI